MPSEFSTSAWLSVVRAPAALRLQDLPTIPGEKKRGPQSQCGHSGCEVETPCHCCESNPNRPEICHTKVWTMACFVPTARELLGVFWVVCVPRVLDVTMRISVRH